MDKIEQVSTKQQGTQSKLGKTIALRTKKEQLTEIIGILKQSTSARQRRKNNQLIEVLNNSNRNRRSATLYNEQIKYLYTYPFNFFQYFLYGRSCE